VVYTAPDPVQVGASGSVVKCELTTQPALYFGNKDFGDGIYEVIVPFASQDLIAFVCT
jgi:hypothetical protein